MPWYVWAIIGAVAFGVFDYLIIRGADEEGEE